MMLTIAPPPAAAFDPDAYLQQKSAPFNPDQYLREKDLNDRAADIGAAESFGRGAAQGATLGFGDEAQGGIQAALRKYIQGSDADEQRPFGDLYKEERDVARRDDEVARRANPKTYIGGQLTGGIAPTVVGNGIAGALLKAVAPALAAAPASTTAARLLAATGAAGQGAIQGAGYSNADTARGLASDTALGAGIGLAGYGAGQTVQKVGSNLSGAFARLQAAAASRATQQASDETTSALRTLASKYGAEVQKGSRQVENLTRLEPSMTPAQASELAAQRASGTIPGLEQQVAQSTLDALPSQAQTIAAREAELSAAQAAAPASIASRTADLLSPEETKKQLLARLLRYGPVAAGSALGGYVGGPLGTSIGALAGAGSRPMIRSLIRMGKTPAVQNAVGVAGEWSAEKAADLLRTLLRTAPAATPSLQSLVTQ